MTDADLPMPSDVPGTRAAGAAGASSPAGARPPRPTFTFVRLFVIPLLIAAAVVGVMLPLGCLGGRPMTVEQALDALEAPGGARTAGAVGPAAKRRYMAAAVVADHLKDPLAEAERVRLGERLAGILAAHVADDEAEVRHFLLLALGRVWQAAPGQPAMDSPEAAASRRRLLGALTGALGAQDARTRKAAALALSMWKGRPEATEAVPALVKRLGEAGEDLDVRIAAAVALGSVAAPDDRAAVDALSSAREASGGDAELGWNAALSLARLGRTAESRATVLMLLDRSQLSTLEVHDRERDPVNPPRRTLTEAEVQRFLLNAMEAVRGLEDEQVRARLAEVARADPSPRVRAAAVEILGRR